MENTIYRKFRHRDLERFIKLLGSIWGYEAFSDNPKVRRDLVRLDAYASLFSSTYKEVAVSEVTFSGVLFARPKGPWRGPLTLIYAVLFSVVFLKLLLRSKDSRRGLKNLNRELKACESMTKKRERPYKNEVTLFMVDWRQRGKRMGLTLMNRYEAYLLKKNQGEFHLFTDDHCSYGFYDHHGFHKEATSQVEEILKDRKETFQVMLYTKRIDGYIHK